MSDFSFVCGDWSSFIGVRINPWYLSSSPSAKRWVFFPVDFIVTWTAITFRPCRSPLCDAEQAHTNLVVDPYALLSKSIEQLQPWPSSLSLSFSRCVSVPTLDPETARTMVRRRNVKKAPSERQKRASVDSHATAMQTVFRGASVLPSASTGREPADTKTAPSSTSLDDVRARLHDFSTERDWHRHHLPRNLLLALVGEVGELAELFQWRTDEECQPGLPGFTPAEKLRVSEELADVLAYLVGLSSKCGVDLVAAFDRKMELNAAKYPAALVKGSLAKYDQYRNAEQNAAE